MGGHWSCFRYFCAWSIRLLSPPMPIVPEEGKPQPWWRSNEGGLSPWGVAGVGARHKSDGYIMAGSLDRQANSKAHSSRRRSKTRCILKGAQTWISFRRRIWYEIEPLVSRVSVGGMDLYTISASGWLRVVRVMAVSYESTETWQGMFSCAYKCCVTRCDTPFVFNQDT